MQRSFARQIWLGTLLVLLALGGRPFDAAAAGDAAAWAALQEKARSEGSVVVAGPPVPPLRTAVVEGFKKAYGIDVNYLALRSGEMITRTETEAKLGKVSIDVYIGGSTCWELARRGLVDDITPLIVDPQLWEPAVWRDGKPRLVGVPQDLGLPAEFRCFIQMGEWVMTDLFVNPTIIKPGTIQSWHDLLKPEYKDKIVAFDPRRTGPGQTTVSFLSATFGDEFVEKLYSGQNVRLAADTRQLAEWVARGAFPIGLSIVQSGVEVYRREGLPIERLFPKDGLGAVTGGFNTALRTKNSPHPNAGALFINWLASREGQTLYQEAMLEKSLRTDVGNGSVPEYVIPREGVRYFDSYDFNNHFNTTLPAVERLTQRLQR